MSSWKDPKKRHSPFYTLRQCSWHCRDCTLRQCSCHCRDQHLSHHCNIMHHGTIPTRLRVAATNTKPLGYPLQWWQELFALRQRFATAGIITHNGSEAQIGLWYLSSTTETTLLGPGPSSLRSNAGHGSNGRTARPSLLGRALWGVTSLKAGEHPWWATPVSHPLRSAGDEDPLQTGPVVCKWRHQLERTWFAHSYCALRKSLLHSPMRPAPRSSASLALRAATRANGSTSIARTSCLMLGQRFFKETKSSCREIKLGLHPNVPLHHRGIGRLSFSGDALNEIRLRVQPRDDVADQSLPGAKGHCSWLQRTRRKRHVTRTEPTRANVHSSRGSWTSSRPLCKDNTDRDNWRQRRLGDTVAERLSTNRLAESTVRVWP